MGGTKENCERQRAAYALVTGGAPEPKETEMKKLRAGRRHALAL